MLIHEPPLVKPANDKDKLTVVACKTFMPRETRMAAPVSFIRWILFNSWSKIVQKKTPA